MQASLHNKFPPPSHEEQPATEPLHLYAKLGELTSPDWHTPACGVTFSCLATK
jgi:hypothetical protein